MTTATHPDTLAAPQTQGWFSRITSWLDDHGKGAWIAAMVLGFIVVWPLGLAILFYTIWSNRLFTKTRSCTARPVKVRHPSGNHAFDSYKAETLNRLQEEQTQFEEFMARLREAKDKAEFDQFMDDRAEAAKAPAEEDSKPKA